MIAESDVISRSYAKIRNYNLYSSNHPSSRLHGGVAQYIQNYILQMKSNQPHFMELLSILQLSIALQHIRLFKTNINSFSNIWMRGGLLVVIMMQNTNFGSSSHHCQG